MENPPRSRTTWGIAVDTIVVSMAASAIAVISAISTGRRCSGRAAGWAAGGAGAVIERQPTTKRTPAPVRPRGRGGSAAGPAPGPAGQRVRAHRGQQHEGEDQVLCGRAHPEQVDAVVDGGDDQAAQHYVQPLE